MLSIQTVAYAFLGGLLPAILWLLFWLREDKLHPEPRKFIIFSFVLGMIAVPLVLPFEKLALSYIGKTGYLILAWAVIEEVFKYAAAYFGGLRSRAMDEPIDALIYLITAALGFAALENGLFLLNPLIEGNVLLGVVTGNVRFIGATLLHTISSAAIGATIAFSFYKRKAIRFEYLTVGFILAIGLHALFNYLILQSEGGNLFFAFFLVWIIIIGLILIFERVKRIKRKSP